MEEHGRNEKPHSEIVYHDEACSGEEELDLRWTYWKVEIIFDEDVQKKKNKKFKRFMRLDFPALLVLVTLIVIERRLKC